MPERRQHRATQTRICVTALAGSFHFLKSRRSRLTAALGRFPTKSGMSETAVESGHLNSRRGRRMGGKADASLRTINIEEQRQRKVGPDIGPTFFYSACNYSPIVGSSSSS